MLDCPCGIFILNEWIIGPHPAPISLVHTLSCPSDRMMGGHKRLEMINSRDCMLAPPTCQSLREEGGGGFQNVSFLVLDIVRWPPLVDFGSPTMVSKTPKGPPWLHVTCYLSLLPLYPCGMLLWTYHCGILFTPWHISWNTDPHHS